MKDSISLIRSFKWITNITLILLFLFIALPLVRLNGIDENFIIEQKLPTAIFNTLFIGVGVVLISNIIAITFATFNVFYDYRFKKIIHLFAILPLAIPAYIHSYNFSVMLSYGGSLSFLNIDIMNIYGAIFIYSISLFPYIYLIVRSTLKRIPYNIIETGMLYDKNFFNIYRKIIAPLIIKSVLAGSILVLAEVFSDIGVVEYFNITTISTVIKQSYVVLMDYGNALKLGCAFGIIMITLFFVEKLIYKNMRFSTSKLTKIKLRTFDKKTAVLFYAFSIAVIGISFVIPIIQMIIWSTRAYEYFNFETFILSLWNTSLVAFISLAIIIVLSLIISHTLKYTKRYKYVSTMLNLGYILPSMILSIIMVIFVAVLNDLGFKVTIATTLVPLIITYVIKYISIGMNTIEKSYNLIHDNINNASIMLGKNPIKTFFLIDLPLLKNAIITSSALILIDIYKEFTLSYSLKPFGFETLSTSVSIYANNEMVQESAIHSLTIVAICSILVILVERIGKKK